MEFTKTVAFGDAPVTDFDDAHGKAWSKLEPALADNFVKHRLIHIVALACQFSFAYALLDNLLLSVEKVAVWFPSKPDAASVVAFMTSLGVTWVNAASASLLARDKMLVAVEVICFVNDMTTLDTDRRNGGPSSADPHDLDTPLDPAKAKTYDGTFLRVLGRPPQPLLLGPPSLMGSFMRQFLSGVFVEVPLKYVVLFSAEVTRWHGTRIISDVQSGKQTVVGKALTKDVRGMMDAVMRLKCVSYVRLYFGVAFRAPVTEYPGDASIGAIGKDRYQYDMYTHELYCGIVDEISVLLGEEHLAELKYRFSVLHRNTHNTIKREGSSYCEALQKELMANYGFMRAPAPFRPKKPLVTLVTTPVKPTIPSGGDPPGGKRTFDDIRKLPGFIEGIRTYGSGKECTQLAAIDEGKKVFCQYYCSGRDCSFASCNRAHLCDVILADKKAVCCQPHTRQEHVAALGLPAYG
jgi:hypothetical protein